MPSIANVDIDLENGLAPENEESQVHWHVMDIEATLAQLDLPPHHISSGLSSSEAERRLELYGPNKLTEGRKATLLERIWKQVNNVLVFILVIVAVVSAVRAITAETNDDLVTNWIQVGLIVSVISLNTYIGIVQEGSAEKAAEALKGLLSAEARVIRDGMEKMVPAQDVVPGDMLVISTGDKVPSDLRLVSVSNLACSEAALTGEAVPIDKTVEAIEIAPGALPETTPLGDRQNMCFSATLVAQGTGLGIAIATGDHTEIGTINALVSKTKAVKTAVLQQIDYVSKILAFFICLAALSTFLVAFLKTKLDAIDSVAIALTCAVGMIPEGLEAIVTLTYAWAVSNMAKRNAIIRALPAVETLGSVTVICSDKTGTLTQNLMSLTAFVTSNARYQIDVDSKERVNSNFVRNDGFLAERAQFDLKTTREAFDDDGADLEGGSETLVVEMDQPDAKTSAAKDHVAVGESPSTQYIKGALAGGVLCSHCVLGENGTRTGEIGNPTELSILRAAYFAGIDVEGLKEDHSVVAEVPFSSEYKFMATVHEPKSDIDPTVDATTKYVVHAKGAPDRMIPLCAYQSNGGSLTQVEPIDRDYWTEQIAILSSHGLRVLALTRGVVNKTEVAECDQLSPAFVNGRSQPWLTIMGLCAIMDPPRPECVRAIKEAHGAGVRVAMITGDHRETAIAIGHTLGIVDEDYPEAKTGPEMDAMSDEELRAAVMKHNVFARASPQNKIRIVKALQAEGQVSSMTGDGVNDAPALKAADMGVAMGLEGTDVAREAAEMILADDNFATIVQAVQEGRVVWDNLRKVLLVNTPINNAQGLSVLFGLALGLSDTPLTAIQILYSNLICAVTLGFVTAIEPAEEGIMNNPPRRVGKRIIGRYLFLRIVLATAVLVMSVVGSAFWAKHLGYDLKEMRSQAFNTLNLGAISVTLSARFAYNSSIHARIFRGNKWCWYSVAVVAILQIVITYTPGLNSVIFSMKPMSLEQWGISVMFMVATFIIMEVEKAVRRFLRSRGEDTDDRSPWIFDEVAQEKETESFETEGSS